MSDIGLSNTVSSNANVQTQAVQAGATGSYSGALQASQHGASLSGSGGAGVTTSVTPPQVPQTPDVAGHVTGTVTGKLDAVVQGVHAQAQAALQAMGGVPDVMGMVHGAWAAVGHLAVHATGGFTAALGF